MYSLCTIITSAYSASIDPRNTSQELYDNLRQFCNREAPAFLGDVVADGKFDLLDLTPDAAEILEAEPAEGSQRQQASWQMLHAVQDRAQVIEEIADLERGADGAAASAASSDDHSKRPAEADEVPGNPGNLVAEEGCPEIPTTLIHVLKSAIASGGAEFALGESTGLGQAALLKRLVRLGPSIRAFVRNARLQEALLSAATLNGCREPLSPWNRREHELAVARRAVAVNHARLSRAQAWHHAQQALSKSIQPLNSKASASDAGMLAPSGYFPLGVAENPQVVAFAVDGTKAKIDVGVVLSAYRGTVVRKKVNIVRTARPFPGELPAESTKLLHLAMCVFDAEHNEFTTSVLEPCVQAEPVNCVYGQLAVAASKASATRLHFRLTPAALESLRILRDKGRPPINPMADVPENPAEEGDMGNKGAELDGSTLQFNEWSFMRAGLPAQCKKFLVGLEALYRSKGWPFLEQGSNMVRISEKQVEPWDQLMERVPGYFNTEFSAYQGHRFSRAVHAKFQSLVPTSYSAHFMCSACWLRRVTWDKRAAKVQIP